MWGIVIVLKNMSTSKKFFFGSVVFFLITFLFWGVYNLSFRDSKSVSEESEKTSMTNKSLASKEKISVITDEPVISPVILSDDVTIQYYSKDKGHMFQIDLEGNNKKTISAKDISGLEDIIWSSSREKVLSKSTGAGETIFSYFDLDKKKGAKLDKNIKNVNFQNENKIIYSYQPSSEKASLNVADFDGKNWKKLTDLDFFGQNLEMVPNTGLVSFWNYADANYETKLYTIPLIGEERKLIFGGKFGGDFLWNFNGLSALMSSSNQKEGNQIKLGLFNFNELVYRDLNIPTFVQKCAWSKNNKTVFYALPGSIPENIVLPNDYLKSNFNTVDTFWKVDIESGEKERLIELKDLEEKFDAIDLFLNNDESILFFTNRYDGRLYRIKL